MARKLLAHRGDEPERPCQLDADDFGGGEGAGQSQTNAADAAAQIINDELGMRRFGLFLCDESLNGSERGLPCGNKRGDLCAPCIIAKKPCEKGRPE